MSEQRVTVWVQKFNDRPALVLQWIDPATGKRKSRSAGTADPKAAEAARVDLESDLNNNRYLAADRMPWSRFRELFETEYLAGRREGTAKAYRNTLDLFERLCRPRDLRGVNERIVSAFAAGLRKERGRAGGGGMQASSVKGRLSTLRAVLRWAADQRLIPACPKFPAVKVPRKRPQPVPTEAFEKLLAKAPDGQWRAFLLCGWLAGLRRNEALLLEWAEADKAPWLDLGRNRIILPAEFVKGAEDQWVPIDPVLRAALEALPRQGKRVFRFAWPGAGTPLSPSGVSLWLGRLAKDAGVRMNMRSLRRGFGCRHAAKVPAQVLQRLMRHASISTTVAFYANVDAAVEEAILGPQRNASRNKPPQNAPQPDEDGGCNPSYDNELHPPAGL
jgi:integrase